MGYYALVSSVGLHFKASGYHVNLISGQAADSNRELIKKSAQNIISVVKVEIETVGIESVKVLDSSSH